MEKMRIQLLIFCFATPLTVGSVACTGQLPGSFRYLQQEQNFSSQLQINTKIDLLWVVDNSTSMDVSQEKLRGGFEAFATRYMKPTWDIRVAVITTDTYLANTAFSTYLNKTVPGSVGWTSTYISGRLGTFQNPSWNTSLVNLANGSFPSGIKYGEIVPAWRQNYARLLPGLHDGPVSAFCFEAMPYFMKGLTQCQIRDDQTQNTGIANCLNPNTGSGESSLSQCVNTVQNDTVRTGRAIIETVPPTGTAADATWSAQLIQDFRVNLTTGSSGHNSERGIGSVLQLLSDNESTATAFFRKDSLRGIIFVTDEEDQTLRIPETPDAGFSPDSFYACDQAGLIAANPTANISGVGGYCCSNPANGCKWGSAGTTCASVTVGSLTYTPSICADPAQLLPVSEAKDTLDTFFRNLDQTDGSSSPNYFVVSIVPLDEQAIQDLQTAREATDTTVGTLKTKAVERGERYLALGNLVGNGSLSMNLAETDYTPILNTIGQSIIEKKSVFTLDRAPTGSEDMIIRVNHADGTSTIIPESKYLIDGKSIRITDEDFVLGLSRTDTIAINYQPKTAY